MMEIRFISKNKHKIKEAETILGNVGINVVPINIVIDELQTEDAKHLVKDKALKAFRHVGRPLLVEHTGLYLNALNGLPGGLTQIFWDKLEADKFSQLFGRSTDPSVIAKTIIAYTDARNFFIFESEVRGIISTKPRGPRAFQWDCVFIPDGYSETFAEMGNKKNNISMRRIALDQFSQFLKKRGHK